MIYLLAGHAVVNGKGTGAFGVDGFDEAVEALKFRNDLTKELLSKGVAVVNENPALNLNQVITWLSKLVKKGDIVIEFHFNAGPSAAKGVESFVDDTYTREEFSLAKNISSAISIATGDVLRGNAGVKKESESQHKSLAILSNVSVATNVLVELAFLSNRQSVDSYRKNYKKVVSSVAEQIVLAAK